MPKKILLFSLGWISLAVGILGIFLPLVPTTPLVLLASWCFARSSRRFHGWLRSNGTLGPIIDRWEAGAGIAPDVRNRALVALWLTLAVSAFVIGQWWAPIVLGCCGAIGSFCLFRFSKLGTDKVAATPASSN